MNYLMLLHTTPEPSPTSEDSEKHESKPGEKKDETDDSEIIECSAEDARKFFKTIKI